MKTFDELFEEYRLLVMPLVERPSVQHTETRRAFFSGAFIMYTEMMTTVAMMSDEDAQEVLLKVKADLEGFYAKIKAGVEDY